MGACATQLLWLRDREADLHCPFPQLHDISPTDASQVPRKPCSWLTCCAPCPPSATLPSAGICCKQQHTIWHQLPDVSYRALQPAGMLTVFPDVPSCQLRWPAQVASSCTRLALLCHLQARSKRPQKYPTAQQQLDSLKERLVKAREQLELARQQVDRAGQELSDRVSESVALPPAWREKPVAWSVSQACLWLGTCAWLDRIPCDGDSGVASGPVMSCACHAALDCPSWRSLLLLADRCEFSLHANGLHSSSVSVWVCMLTRVHHCLG